MVKRTSLFARLKSRFRTSSVRVDKSDRDAQRSGSAARGSAPGSAPGSASGDGSAVADGNARLDAVAPRRGTTSVFGRKISQKEAAVIAIQDGFKDLSGLLRGLQARIEEQGDRAAETDTAQLETMRLVAERLERQREANELAIQSFKALPDTLREVRTALDRAAATDDRTAKTLDEFRSNMDRVQTAMGRMVEESRRQTEAIAGEAAFDQLARKISDEQHRHTDAIAGMVDRIDETQRSGVRSLREAQVDQSTRLGKLVEEGTRTNRAILVLLGLTFFALVVIAVLLLGGS